ncbi:MAG TPA: WXG100 family type VII secretion target [Kutzneria sp.]|nr:WXG100 family type VII secretion target [Kutzneria sp.]
MDMSPHTNFAQYSHEQLYTMLFASDPETVGDAADIWDTTGKGLHDKANDLRSQLSGFSDKWQGGAAQQYQSMIGDLAEGIRKVADTAFAMRDLTHDAGEALTTARAKMPKPVNVPQVSPSVVSLATTQIQVQADTPPQVVAQMQQQQSAAIAQVRDQQSAVAASNAAHAEAVMVMQALAGDYTTAQQSIPPSPNAEQVPSGTTPTTTQSDSGVSAPIVSSSWVNAATGTTTTLPAGGGVPTGQQQGGSPLFGGMFTAGLAAASAAAFGRFGSIMPKIPGFAKPKSDEKSTTPAGAKLGDSASFKLPGGGGGGGGIGGIGGGGVPGSSVPTSMISGAGSPTADLAGGALGAAVADAAGSKAMGPMMPMMPMNGAGANDMGGGRRIPPWLVETEDVWGESSAVAPSVIGEDF